MNVISMTFLKIDNILGNHVIFFLKGRDEFLSDRFPTDQNRMLFLPKN
jgi:hypothetical protein